jgi:hypothetical protein
MSALLFLELHIPNHEYILIKPFPSEHDVRYPDIWLDPSFFEMDEKDGVGNVRDEDAFDILQVLLPTVSPSLLFRLTEAAVEALFNVPPEESKAKIAMLERLAYGFLSLLAQSDRPSLATEFILKVIIDRSDSSSWHRKLMSIGFLRRLSSAQARNLIQTFANAINQKLNQQAERTQAVASPDDGDSAVPRPYIKVTTVKYLAQLLNGADFVPVKFSVDILGALLKASTHIDIRAAIVESLTVMLSKCEEDESSDCVGNQILQALQSTVPIAVV